MKTLKIAYVFFCFIDTINTKGKYFCITLANGRFLI